MQVCMYNYNGQAKNYLPGSEAVDFRFSGLRSASAFCFAQLVLLGDSLFRLRGSV